MKHRIALVIWCLVCAASLVSACSVAPSSGQGAQANLHAGATPAVISPPRIGEAQTAPTPTTSANTSRPGKADKGAQPTVGEGKASTMPLPAVKAEASGPGKQRNGAQPAASVGEALATPALAANGKASKRGKADNGARPTEGAAAQAAMPPGTARFPATEILGRPTDHSVTVSVVAEEEQEVYFEYGAAPGVFTGRTQAETHPGGKPFEVALDGLQPNTRTYYRIRYRRPGAAEFVAGAEHSFYTQRAPGSTFTFDIQGDSHPERVNKQFDPDLYRRTLLSAVADQPDFYVTIGDDFSVDNLKTVNADTVTQLYVNQRQWLGMVDAPVFLVNGNHEQASLANLDDTPNNVAVWAQNARNAYYPQPAPDGFYTGDAEPVKFIGQLRDYYAWTWGDALFMVIDPYWHSPQTVDNQFGADRAQKAKRDLWNITLGDAQYQWLKRTLETSSARYKFVFAHHVNGTGRGGIELANTCEWGDAANIAVRRPGWDKTIHQLMADNGVTIFFQGHDHIFARQELDGVIYQTLPEPANPFYTYENADAYRSGDKFPNSGHVRVTVTPEQVTVDYVRSFLPGDEQNGQVNGEVAYSYAVSGASPSRTAAPAGELTPPITPSATSTPSTAASFPGNIVLGRPTGHSATASVLSDLDLEAYLEYGTRAGTHTGQTAPLRLPAGQPEEVIMEGLQPDAPYFYRLRFRGPGEIAFAASEEHVFHTQRPPGSAFTFTLDADPHNRAPNFNAEVYSVTLRSALADKPAFHINLGDTFMAEKIAPVSYGQTVATYREMRRFFGLLAGSVPLFLVNGNHDGELGWELNGTAENLGVWATQARRSFYPDPVPGGFYSGSTGAETLTGVRDGYYAWTWGDALFVVLDPFWYSTQKPRAVTDNWNLTLGQAQYQWLKQTLEASHARFKFVFAHNLVGGMDRNMRGGIEAAGMYEWGGRNADGSWGFADHRPGWDAPIHQLLVENHVTILFHGHDHLFVKQDLDGIVYQECPQPSYATYDKTGSALDYGYAHGDVLGGSGYLRVTVTPAAVTVDYVRSFLPKDENGQRRNRAIAYSYTVNAR
jgi:phosphodiesterase/alkaline phosphatase D-like protein